MPAVPVRIALLCMLALLGSSPLIAAETIGIVLMHGKGGMPGQMSGLAQALTAAGYKVETPEMCWSRGRGHNRAYLDCLSDIDAAIARLRSRGAAAIMVGGQSLGGNAAIAYAARHSGLKGVIGLAPAGSPDRHIDRSSVVKSLAEARALIAAGKGDQPASFMDINDGRDFPIQTTPKIYLSFLDPDGPALLPANTARVTVPLLWVAGTSDRTQIGPGYAFAKARNPKNKYVTISSDHLGTPNASHQAVLAWLKELAGN